MPGQPAKGAGKPEPENRQGNLRWLVLNVKQAAERMGISDSLVYELCASGSLPHVRIGRPGSRGCIRLTEGDIQEFLDSQKVGGKAATRPPPKQKRVFKHVVIPN
jgi:excisionase family DNA binding protein